jgi:peptidoglycan/xylan/chitin deacetylase (PgdA/CDA1 family)
MPHGEQELLLQEAKMTNSRLKAQSSRLMNVIILILFISFASCVLSLESFARSVWNGDKTRNVVALTFDDGPKPEYCQPILDMLDKYGAKATFFVVGREAKDNPDLIKRMDDEGDEVANHTYSHTPAKEMTVGAALSDIQKCSQVVYDITGKAPKFFRPPGGGINSGISKGIKKMGMKTVFWSLNATDYTDVTPGYEVPEDVKAMAEELTKRVMDKVKPGTIILLHSSSEQTVRALPLILKALKEKGYGFVTMSELVEERI